MDEIKGKVTCADIAALFMEKAAKESIVSELFDFFGFDCLARISLDHARLDEYISAFEASEYKDAEQLERIIDDIINTKPLDYQPLLNWLENNKNHNGIYILGI